ncbi:Ribokinase-like protein [Halteromyces radiatus]|uniref:Ribokinase-like protein n=1 Tax=Halteromyces radiatus TaxID=101107 RepID=UPI00221F817E|nr:Ribokinase-like protein [Halteromyces radiatus]KAI8081450.1 Ribokinase-like protein [Halteromyces radiatus]
MTNLEDSPSYRVLSIQSHMVSGYCGNKAAAFPLQTLGFDVDILNTVQFSNHTGYTSWTGGRLTDVDVQQLFDGLEANGLMDQYTHVLTGYIGNFDILRTIENKVKQLKERIPYLIYVCDPVLGDGGRLYVAPEIVPLYRDVLSVADVITPNQFEAEVLSDIKIINLKTAKEAANQIHAFGVDNIVITSMVLPPEDVPKTILLPHSKSTESASNTNHQPLYCMTSQRHPNGDVQQHLISFPTYEGYFTGTGDLFSALTVARIQDYPHSLAQAIFKVVASVNAVTRLTWEHQRKQQHGNDKMIVDKPNDPKLVHACELQVIKGKKEIEHPDLIGHQILMVEL